MRNLIMTALFAVFVLGGSTGASLARHFHAPRIPTGCLPGSIKARLSEIRKKFGPITIISTYRPGARIAGTGHRSKHADCRAVDFKLKNKLKAWRWLNKVHNGGLGIYHGKCNHLHIDNGPRARWNRGYCG